MAYLETRWEVEKNKAWKQQQQQKGFCKEIWAHDLFYTGALLYQLSHQTN